MQQPITLQSWRELGYHAQTMSAIPISDLKQTHVRNSSLAITGYNIQIDFSNQLINTDTLALLLSLATECSLENKIAALAQGAIVNLSENKPALHTALRTMCNQAILVNNHDIIPDVLLTRAKIKEISDTIRGGEWLGFSGKPIRDIVNIGIGGSALGPKFCLNALTDLTAKHLNYHFISDVDSTALKNIISQIKPETTLFIVASKSFTTKETLYNMRQIFSWMHHPTNMHRNFIAVTANINKAKNMGFRYILPIWDWIGGRFSLCSAINLITAIGIGYENFHTLLQGANLMDEHFQTRPLLHNLPALLGLVGIWNNNFLHLHNLLMLVYTQYLEHFVPYIQQLDMESNGKSIDQYGEKITYATGPIIWGGLGNQAQHSYYQLLCQGTHAVTLDIITLKTLAKELIHDMYLAKQHVLTHGIHNPKNPHGYIRGNIPLNHIQLTDCSPLTLGQLIAMYEHKVFTQSVIWNINPFDQPGVESTKQYMNTDDILL